MSLLVPLTAACLHALASAYQVPYEDLGVLFKHEPGRLGEKHGNSNGTYDYGPFQVNAVWVPTFTKLWSMPSADATREKLMNDGCWNAGAAAAIFRQALTETKGDRKAAIGRYHTHNPALQKKYIDQVVAQYRILFGG